MCKLKVTPAIFVTLVASCTLAKAECTSEDLVDTNAGLLTRMDTMAACIVSQGRVIEQQSMQIATLESAVLVSEVPCTDLGEGWQLFTPAQDRFILGAGGKYAISQQGGEETVTLSIEQIPSHAHQYTAAVNTRSRGAGSEHVLWQFDSKTTTATGGNQAHNNMPPYTVLYFCKRGS